MSLVPARPSALVLSCLRLPLHGAKISVTVINFWLHNYFPMPDKKELHLIATIIYTWIAGQQRFFFIYLVLKRYLKNQPCPACIWVDRTSYGTPIRVQCMGQVKSPYAYGISCRVGAFAKHKRFSVCL